MKAVLGHLWSFVLGLLAITAFLGAVLAIIWGGAWVIDRLPESAVNFIKLVPLILLVPPLAIGYCWSIGRGLRGIE